MNSDDPASRRPLVQFGGATLTTRVVLQAPAGDVEGFANRHARILVARIRFLTARQLVESECASAGALTRFMLHEDLFTRNSQVDADVISVAGFMPSLGELNQRATARDWGEVGFELARTQENLALETRRWPDAFEADDW